MGKRGHPHQDSPCEQAQDPSGHQVTQEGHPLPAGSSLYPRDSQPPRHSSKEDVWPRPGASGLAATCTASSWSAMQILGLHTHRGRNAGWVPPEQSIRAPAHLASCRPSGNRPRAGMAPSSLQRVRPCRDPGPSPFSLQATSGGPVLKKGVAGGPGNTHSRALGGSCRAPHWASSGAESRGPGPRRPSLSRLRCPSRSPH